MEQSGRTVTNRFENAQKWLSANPDQLDEPNTPAFLIRQFGLAETLATHLVNMEKIVSHTDGVRRS
jgi:hypothetical protein